MIHPHFWIQTTWIFFNTIDSTPLGDVSWQIFSLNYNGEVPDDAPSWMSLSYDVMFKTHTWLWRTWLTTLIMATNLIWDLNRLSIQGSSTVSRLHDRGLGLGWSSTCSVLAMNPASYYYLGCNWNACPDHFWERQNHNFRWNGQQQILPALSLNRYSP